MEMASSTTDLVTSSKSDARTRPRVPEDSDFGRLIMTVVSAAGVVGGSFRMRGFGAETYILLVMVQGKEPITW